LITVENLSKVYHQEPALRGVSFSVAASELTVVIGPSGCGKSTLLRCLNGLERFDQGTIQIGDVRVTTEVELTAQALSHQFRRLRGEVGIVFQGFNLFPHLTILENVALAPRVVRKIGRGEALEQARTLLQKVGLGDRLGYLPGRLSGGQQQRAAIARALAMAPRVMLYDEPTSALDPSLVGDVLSIMRQLDDEGMTQIVVTHEINFAREVADRVLVLHGGELIESGDAEAVFRHPQDPRTRAFLRRYL
jgi:polar amino acid transport system ATP-binding protein